MCSPHSQSQSSLTSEFGLRWNAPLDLLFPPHCLLCGATIANEDDSASRQLCSPCLSDFGFGTFVPCERCAAPLPKLGAGHGNCLYCRERKYRFDHTVTLGIYRGTLRDAVLRMKKATHDALMLAIGNELARRINEMSLGPRPSAVIPVPMHWWRRLTRGVNSAELIAEAISRQLRLPLITDSLRLRRPTRKQGTLLPGERFRNVRGAFVTAGRWNPRGANVLVVDDVMTTGATANEIAKVLRRAGAAHITIAVAARGSGFGDGRRG